MGGKGRGNSILGKKLFKAKIYAKLSNCLLRAFGILFLFLGAPKLLHRLPLVSVITRPLCNLDFHLLCRLLCHLALEHEVLEDVRLEDQLEGLRGSLDGQKAERVQLFRLGEGSEVKHPGCF